MKKILYVTITLLLCISLVGCGDKKVDGKAKNSNTNNNSSVNNGKKTSSDVHDSLATAGLSEEDIKTALGISIKRISLTSNQYSGSVIFSDHSNETFENWVTKLAETCKVTSKDGKLYESEIDWKEITSLDIDKEAAINIVQFIYKAENNVVYVTASSSSNEENAFDVSIQVY